MRITIPNGLLFELVGIMEHKEAGDELMAQGAHLKAAACYAKALKAGCTVPCVFVAFSTALLQVNKHAKALDIANKGTLEHPADEEIQRCWLAAMVHLGSA